MLTPGTSNGGRSLQHISTSRAYASGRALRGVDAPALAGLCRWYSVWRQADARLQRGDGDSYKGSIEAAAAWKNYSAVAAKFGLTPVDREKISVTETTEPENDILDELLA